MILSRLLSSDTIYPPSLSSKSRSLPLIPPFVARDPLAVTDSNLLSACPNSNFTNTRQQPLVDPKQPQLISRSMILTNLTSRHNSHVTSENVMTSSTSKLLLNHSTDSDAPSLEDIKSPPLRCNGVQTGSKVSFKL